ncbi:hypothetical protein [Methylomagnum sp.]
MGWKQIVRVCRILPLLLPGVASALVVEIQGVRLEPDMAGASCVEIAGVYPGVRIESDKPGEMPRVCHSASRINSLSIANATLVALPPLKKEVVIKFEHEFPPGVNGRIVARAKLQGFFATADGVGVPTGDKLALHAFFSQGKTNDVIAEPLDFTVGDSLDTAIFDYSVKKQYLTAGPRALKGELKVTFNSAGHKLTFPDRCLVALDTGATFEDKLETMDAMGGGEFPSIQGAETPGGEAPSPSPLAGGAAGDSNPLAGPKPPVESPPVDSKPPTNSKPKGKAAAAKPATPAAPAGSPGDPLSTLPGLPALEPLPTSP